MDRQQVIDVRTIIQRGAVTSTIDELRRKGYSKVRVVSEARINQLISQAVNAVLDSYSKTMVEQERQKVIEQSRREFDALMKKHQEELQAKEALVQSRDRLKAEVDKLYSKLEEQIQFLASKKAPGLREAVSVQKEGIMALEEQITSLINELDEAQRQRRDAEERVRHTNMKIEMLRLQNETLLRENAQYEKQIEELRGKLQEASTERINQLMSEQEAFTNALAEILNEVEQIEADAIHFQDPEEKEEMLIAVGEGGEIIDERPLVQPRDEIVTADSQLIHAVSHDCGRIIHALKTRLMRNRRLLNLIGGKKRDLQKKLEMVSIHNQILERELMKVKHGVAVVEEETVDPGLIITIDEGEDPGDPRLLITPGEGEIVEDILESRRKVLGEESVKKKIAGDREPGLSKEGIEIGSGSESGNQAEQVLDLVGMADEECA